MGEASPHVRAPAHTRCARCHAWYVECCTSRVPQSLPAACLIALVLSLASTTSAQDAEDGVGERPTTYGYGGFGVLGHVRIERGPGPGITSMSTTGRLGVDVPMTHRFAIGAELRGIIMRGFPEYSSYIGDLSFVTRWRMPIGNGRWTFDIAGLGGPTVGLLWVHENESLMRPETMTGHGMMGAHGGGIAGVVTRIAQKMSFGIHLGYVHQILFAPPSEAAATSGIASPLHLDQVFLETELRFDL